MEQERRVPRQQPVAVYVPPFVKEIVAELTFQARQSPDVSQSSGVSVRASLANYQTVIAAAERRALRTGEREAVPRITDLPTLASSMLGKMELEYSGAEQREDQLMEKLLRRSIKVVFDERFGADDLAAVVRAFGDGWKVEVGDLLPSSEYVDGLDSIAGLRAAIEKLGAVGSPARIASAIEFILEGLHLSNRLNKEIEGRRVLYR
jgi:magnesium chelatase subunit I